MALSIRMNLAKSEANRISVSTASLARIVGMSSAKLSDVFRDVSSLKKQEEAELESLVSRLAYYSDAIEPLRLPFSWEMLRELSVSQVEPSEVKEFVARIFLK